MEFSGKQCQIGDNIAAYQSLYVVWFFVSFVLKHQTQIFRPIVEF
jgi:hypothetical protein